VAKSAPVRWLEESDASNSSNNNMNAVSASTMKPVSEAVVVGGGPAGSFTAWNLSKLGVETTVFEEHAEIGVPSHCAGHISIRSLRKFGLYPLPKGIVENTFSAANFYSPNGTSFSVRLERPVTCALNRELFDKFLATKAEAAGAHYRLGSRVHSLIIDAGFAKGINIEQASGVESVEAKVVVDAEGISARFVKEAGLAAPRGDGLVYAVEAEVENVRNLETDSVEVFVGKEYAPGFYGWIMPLPNETAKVGLATKTGNPKDLLQKLMFKHPVAAKLLKGSQVKQSSFHPVTLGGPIANTYANGFLVVGDAASQVKPTTGGGVIFGLTCGQLAAETASEAIKRKDISSDFLRKYQERCDEKLGFDFAVMLRIRKFLDSLSDKKINSILRVCNRLGLGKALKDVDEIDFQGKLLLEMLTKPSAYATFAYLLVLYLSANP
jgi:digeranylgeranylglycerophospholipid reductase